MRANLRVAESQDIVDPATTTTTSEGAGAESEALSVLANVAQSAKTPEAASHVSSTALVLRNNRSTGLDDQGQTTTTDPQTAMVVAAPSHSSTHELVVADSSEVTPINGDAVATKEASPTTAEIEADTSSSDSIYSPIDPSANGDSTVEIYDYLDHRANIISNPEKAYTLICTDAAFDLEEWHADDVDFGAQARLLLLGDIRRAVRDEHGQLWSEGAMLGRMYGAAAHSTRARFYRNVGLVQLAAWVAERQRAPDVHARHRTDRDRYTAVLDILVKHDRQRRGRDTWRRECAAGRHWTTFVQRFGVGVAIVKPRLLGLNSKGFVLFTPFSQLFSFYFLQVSVPSFQKFYQASLRPFLSVDSPAGNPLIHLSYPPSPAVSLIPFIHHLSN